MDLYNYWLMEKVAEEEYFEKEASVVPRIVELGRSLKRKLVGGARTTRRVHGGQGYGRARDVREKVMLDNYKKYLADNPSR